MFGTVDATAPWSLASIVLASWMHGFGEKPVVQMMGNPRSQSLKEVQNSTESWLKLSFRAA
jgi:hypothetical protein